MTVSKEFICNSTDEKPPGVSSKYLIENSFLIEVYQAIPALCKILLFLLFSVKKVVTYVLEQWTNIDWCKKMNVDSTLIGAEQSIFRDMLWDCYRLSK